MATKQEKVRELIKGTRLDFDAFWRGYSDTSMKVIRRAIKECSSYTSLIRKDN